MNHALDVDGDARLERAASAADIAWLPREDAEQSLEVMDALGRWRAADRALSEASRRYMRLNETDMRAIRQLVLASASGRSVTAKDIAQHVGISSAATTKLVDRLVAGGHAVRVPHATDRRARCIEVTPVTRAAAMASVGRQHARRFAAAAMLSADERAVVIRFLDALTEADAPIDELLGHPASVPHARS